MCIHILIPDNFQCFNILVAGDQWAGPVRWMSAQSDSLRSSDFGNIDIGSGNGVLPDDTKPLPEPMMTHYLLDPKEQI